MNKFKIGDRVKSIKYNQEFIIKGIEYRFYWELEDNPFYESDLELVQTSEELAVEKALKEFKGKMQKEVEQEVRYLKGELRKTSNNWDKRGYAIRNCVYQTGYKLLKLLNEADDLISGEEYLKKQELLK